MPNRPITTGTMPKPSSSSIRPKVKRGAPTTGSVPICASNSPRIAAISPRTSERLASPVTSDSPTSRSAKDSGGPNESASLVSGKARSTSPMVATVPPTKEPIAAIASAGPARPRFAISYPSMQVTAEAASPGVLINTDVMVPPYIAP